MATYFIKKTSKGMEKKSSYYFLEKKAEINTEDILKNLLVAGGGASLGATIGTSYAYDTREVPARVASPANQHRVNVETLIRNAKRTGKAGLIGGALGAGAGLLAYNAFLRNKKKETQ